MRIWILGVGGVASGVMAVAAAFWLVPPLRMSAPEIFGMACAERVCTETVSDLRRAVALVGGARTDVEMLSGLPVPPLRAVLCRTAACYERFDGGAERAISYPFQGMVVAGRSWQDYIIRHELIHWLQFEYFGAVETMGHPVWFREGMAYALSGAPDWDIPATFTSWVAQYRAWQGGRSVAAVLSAKPTFE